VRHSWTLSNNQRKFVCPSFNWQSKLVSSGTGNLRLTISCIRSPANGMLKQTLEVVCFRSAELLTSFATDHGRCPSWAFSTFLPQFHSVSFDFCQCLLNSTVRIAFALLAGQSGMPTCRPKRSAQRADAGFDDSWHRSRKIDIREVHNIENSRLDF
jgi:hypothetical protein